MLFFELALNTDPVLKVILLSITQYKDGNKKPTGNVYINVDYIHSTVRRWEEQIKMSLPRHTEG